MAYGCIDLVVWPKRLSEGDWDGGRYDDERLES